MAEAGKTFGTCCEELKEALEGGDFEPCLTVGPNEIIYMTIGLVAQEGDETAHADHPLFFCPFCGAKLQTEEEVEAKAAADGNGEGEEEPRRA